MNEEFTQIQNALKGLEETMIRNIANSLLQIHFHDTATAEELMQYYGWKETFEESERQKLIDDTLARLEAEQQILKFYQDNKEIINNKYGNKNPTGDLGLTVQRSTREDAQQESVSDNAREDDDTGSEQGSSSDTGLGNADTEAGNGEDEA